MINWIILVNKNIVIDLKDLDKTDQYCLFRTCTIINKIINFQLSFTPLFLILFDHLCDLIK